MTAEPATGAETNVLHARLQGLSGDVIVLLHGVGGLASLWDAIAARLSAHHRTIAYDLPGHAGSLHYPGAGPVKVAVAAILDDLRRRGIDRAHLVGHSMGGAIATLAAISHPELVATLTLVAPGGMGEEINRLVLQRFAAATSIEDLTSCMVDMSAPGTQPSDVNVEAQVNAKALPGQSEMLSAIVERITRDGKQGVIPRDLLGVLSMPVSVVWGTEDPILPFAQTQNLPETFKVLPVLGAGHMLLDEAPDAVVAAVEANLAAAESH